MGDTPDAGGVAESVVVYGVIGVTGARILVEDALTVVDGALGWVERGIVVVSLWMMVFLAFNEYLEREYRDRLHTDLMGLWAIDGQMNIALLLMVVVGFIGASIATQEGKHIAVDAIDKVLGGTMTGVVKRIVAASSMILTGLLSRGAIGSVLSHCNDTFEGVKVFGWMVGPINALTSLLPYAKFGAGTPFADRSAWEDAQYAANPNLSFSDIPPAFRYVVPGDGFPLWLPLMVLAGVFALMSARFAVQVLVPRRGPDSDAADARPFGRADLIAAIAIPVAGALLAYGVSTGSGLAVLLSGVSLALIGSPLFVAAGIGTVLCWTMLRDGSTESVVNDMFEATKKQELLSIPFFVLAGNVMTSGVIASRLIDLARALLGPVPGGLGGAAVLACAFFAAISGSSPVTVIAIGSIMFPMLIREKYEEKYALGVLSTAGSLGIIIPPSIPMIVYAVMVSGSSYVDPVTHQLTPLSIDPTVLFSAGILPGLFMATALIAYTLIIHRNVPIPGGRPSVPVWGANVGRAFWRAIPSLMLPVIILGGIYGLVDLERFGIPFALRFTVTEAAAVGVVYALFVELAIHREMKLRALWDVCVESAVSMGSLFVILVIALSLNRFLTFQQVPEAATAWVLSLVHSRAMFLIAVNLLLLIVGALMDIMSAIFIIAPLLAPIASSYGIHPIHFAIMFIVNLEIGYLTPPMGINLFVATTTFKRPLLSVIRAVVPFLFIMLFCLAVIVWWPWLSLALVE